MQKYREIYIWWIGVLLLATGAYWGYYNGYITDILQKDITHLASLISVLFVGHIAYLGHVAYLIKNARNSWGDEIPRIKGMLGNMWFISEIFLALGILGTVLGIIHMTGITPTSSTPEAISEYLAQMWPALSVAFYPNAIGLIASITTKVMTHYISRGLDELSLG